MDKEKKIAKIDQEMAELKAKMADERLCEGTAYPVSRISGYARPAPVITRDGRILDDVCNWNTGKTQEWQDRKTYNI